MTADPYVYPGTDVLRNRFDVRDQEDLARLERLRTLQRHREGFPAVKMTADGYRQLHHHLFQDLYDWAGRDRTVDLARESSVFCLAPHIGDQLRRRFALIR